ncbi:MAG: MarR family transcriptional regulator [Armatimonadetes bacterium]|jgi:DNA-binding MarR family transcriptional regulator|nr:MarR family transcriptional regulator [Armatimonadota bacterium]
MDVNNGYDYRTTPTMRLLRALVEANDWLRKLDDERIRTYGLSTAEFDCLVTLGVEQPLRMCDLAQRSLLTKSHTTQIMKQMEAKSLVNRQRSRQSEREVLVSLTPEGEELFNRVYPVQYEFLKELFGSRLTAAEQEELTRLLRKLADG